MLGLCFFQRLLSSFYVCFCLLNFGRFCDLLYLRLNSILDAFLQFSCALVKRIQSRELRKCTAYISLCGLVFERHSKRTNSRNVFPQRAVKERRDSVTSSRRALGLEILLHLVLRCLALCHGGGCDIFSHQGVCFGIGKASLVSFVWNYNRCVTYNVFSSFFTKLVDATSHFPYVVAHMLWSKTKLCSLWGRCSSLSFGFGRFLVSHSSVIKSTNTTQGFGSQSLLRCGSLLI